MITQWRPERDATPATVEGTRHGDLLMVLRFDSAVKGRTCVVVHHQHGLTSGECVQVGELAPTGCARA